MLVVDAADGLRQAVGHDGPGGDDDLHEAGIDHLADQQPHLCHAHRPGDREHAGAVRVVGHGPEDLEGLAQLAAAEGCLGHPLEEIGEALRDR